MWLVVSPYFSVSGNLGDKLTISGAGSLGASLRLSLREEDTFSTSSYLRPSGAIEGTWEAVDNFFFVDYFAGLQSTLDDPFLATTDPTSPVNTTTSYQVGVTPYIRGSIAAGYADYELRSANYWTNSWSDRPDYSGQYSATNSVRVDRAPQPFGFAFLYEQRLLSSDVEGQPLLNAESARLSLRYALTDSLAVGVRIGAERYNFTLAARDWQSYYGAEFAWRPNSRTSLEGYWEDRVFGNSWQVAFNYRRPRAALTVTSSRLLSSTPQQFLTFPGLANLSALLNASLETRIPDPAARQRAVNDLLARTPLPADLLVPSIIYTENFTIQETSAARLVFFGQRYSLAWNMFYTITQSAAGISSTLPVASETLQRGTSLVYSRALARAASFSATASWRNTQDRLDTSRETTQKTLRLDLSRDLTSRITGTLGARYQWITSTVTNDATEAAVYGTLNYRFF